MAVHHGGAGTTTAAARAGCGQLIVPKLYDQYYWLHRVQQLGIGVGLSPENLSVSAVTSAVRECMQPAIAGCARSLANWIKLREAHRAAARLLGEFG